jgi:hypothetical protein
MLIPYVVVPLFGDNDSMPIKKIIIGPTPHKELSSKSVSQLTKKSNLKNVEIITSKIPFRNW